MIKYITTTLQSLRIPLSVELKGSGPLIFSESDNDIGWLYHFEVSDEWRDYYVIYAGPVTKNFQPDISKIKLDQSVPVRIDSGCTTGIAFGDKTCECKDQLGLAIQLIRKNALGIVIHIPSQDGRGMGIDFKLRTLYLQHVDDLDTISAARSITGSDNIDRRTYHGAIGILNYLGLDSRQKLNIATNNPDKIEAFISAGYKNIDRISMNIKKTKLTKKHLNAKKQHLNHKIN